MLNDEHLSWLDEGVDAWNERRSRDNFWPELYQARFDERDLTNVNFSFSDLRESLFGEWAQGEAISEAATIRNANFENGDLRVAYLNLVDFEGVNLSGVNVSTVFYEIGENPSYRSLHEDERGWWHTDLSNALNLSQLQVDSMIGDTGTLLPKGISYPKHWPTVLTSGREFTPFVSTSENTDSAKIGKETLAANREVALLSGASLVENIKIIRGSLNQFHNHIEPKKMMDLLRLLDLVEKQINSIVSANSELEIRKEANNFRDSFKKTIYQLLSQERLGEVVGVSALIVSGATFGSAIGLASASLITGPAYPLVIAGGALGTKIGSAIAGQSKIGSLAEKSLEKLDESSKEN